MSAVPWRPREPNEWLGFQVFVHFPLWVSKWCPHSQSIRSQEDACVYWKFSLFQWPSSLASSSPVRAGTSWPPPSSTLGFLCGLIVYRSCACHHNSCQFLCAAALLCRERTVFLSSSTPRAPIVFLLSSSVMIPEPWEERVWYKCPLALNILKSHSLHVGQMWVSVLLVNSHYKK